MQKTDNFFFKYRVPVCVNDYKRRVLSADLLSFLLNASFYLSNSSTIFLKMEIQFGTLQPMDRQGSP